MAEWFNAPVLKTGGLQNPEGSNPSLSANWMYMTFELRCPKDDSGILFRPISIEFVCEQGHELTVQELKVIFTED